MKFRAKKRGVTFLEIVLALSIIGIISITVFNNIYFSLRQNKLAQRRQEESLVQQTIFEELSSLGNDDFKNMLMSLDNELEESFPFLPSEFIEKKDSTTKTFLAEGTEKIEQFKVYQKKGSDIYAKILFHDYTRGDKSLGVDKEYSISGIDGEYDDGWKGINECSLAFILDKKTLAGLTTYSFEITGANQNVRVKYEGLALEDLEGIISMFDNSEMLVKNVRESDKRLVVAQDEYNVFIKNATEVDVPFKVLNESDKTLNIFVDQKLKNGGNGRVLFTTYGDNINFFMNDSVVNPNAERIDGYSMCKFEISVFQFSNGNFKKHSSIPGYKKFKRFDI